MTTYFSEVNVWSAESGGDFAEIATPTGTDLSGWSVYVYNSDGTVKSGPFSLGTVENTIAGQDVYVIDQPTDGISLTYGDGLVLVDDTGTPQQFVSVGDTPFTATNGPASGQTSQAMGDAGSGESLQSDDEGQTYYMQSNQNKGTVPCFGRGTLIETRHGQVEVERLRPGQVVRTLGTGWRAVKWVHSVTQDCQGEQLPILIKAGALGPNRPSRDLIVSANHRILVGSDDQMPHLFPSETLVPAKALVGARGIRVMRGRKRMTWYHFAIEPHGVVYSNGCATESLLLGAMVLNRLHHFERASLRNTFSRPRAVDGPLNGELAFPCPSVRDVKNRIAAMRERSLA